MTGSPVVDFHGHLAVPAADALVAGTSGLAAELAAEQRAHSPASLAANRAQLQRLAPKLTDVTTRLADLDAMGVDIQVVGPMPMHHYWADPDLAINLARTVNAAVAAHCATAPDRLYGLGTVPLQHPDLAVALLDQAVNDHGLYGISVSTTVDDRELADPAHDVVWQRAEELGAIVFVHPWGCSLGERLATNYLGNTVGQPVETTVALSHLIFTGVLDRFPRLKLVAAHGGGYLPTYIGRSDHAWQVREDARGCLSRRAPICAGCGSTRSSTPRARCVTSSRRWVRTGSSSVRTTPSTWVSTTRWPVWTRPGSLRPTGPPSPGATPSTCC